MLRTTLFIFGRKIVVCFFMLQYCVLFLNEAIAMIKLRKILLRKHDYSMYGLHGNCRNYSTPLDSSDLQRGT